MKKRALFIVGALLLCATIAIGGTLAYLADSESKTNTFTFDKDKSLIDIDLLEPGWENGTPGLNNGEPGKTTADTFIPGTKIAKDPQVKLVKGVDSYVALIIKADTTKDLKTVKAILEVTKLNDLDTANWDIVQKDDAIYAFYKGGSGYLTAGTTTAPLFKSVSILNTYPTGHANDGEPIPQTAYGSFDLVVEAYGVQSRNDEAATWTCKDAMLAAFPTAFAGA